jgi:type I restriction enzyme M protein
VRAESPAQGLAWKLVAKAELLANKDVTLNAERYMGGADEEHEHEVVTIGEICVDVQSGYSCSASKRTATGVPHLRSQNVTEQGQLTWEGVKFVPEEVAAENESYELRKGDILFNNTNSVELVGKTCLYDSTERAHYSNHTTRVRVDEARATPKFVALALHRLFKRGDFAKLCTRWVGQAGVSTTLLKQVEIPLPPLEEQRRIVAEIEGYQKVLDGARQILAGYIPLVEVSPDWPTIEIGEVAEFKNGVNYSKESAGKGIKVLGVRHFQSHVIAPLDDLDEINPAGVLSDGHVLEDGDLIFVRSNGNKELVGRCLLVQPRGLRLTHSAFTIRMRLDRKRCEPKFYAFLFRLPEFRAQMMGGGANINNLSQDILKAIEIPLPPLSEQRRIVAELDAEAAQMDAVRALLPRFEAKIQRVLDRVWGNGGAA